ILWRVNTDGSLLATYLRIRRQIIGTSDHHLTAVGLAGPIQTRVIGHGHHLPAQEGKKRSPGPALRAIGHKRRSGLTQIIHHFEPLAAVLPRLLLVASIRRLSRESAWGEQRGHHGGHKVLNVV